MKEGPPERWNARIMVWVAWKDRLCTNITRDGSQWLGGLAPAKERGRPASGMDKSADGAGRRAGADAFEHRQWVSTMAGGCAAYMAGTANRAIGRTAGRAAQRIARRKEAMSSWLFVRRQWRRCQRQRRCGLE